MEKFEYSFGRLLAAVAFIGGAVASAPTFGLTITVNGPGTCTPNVVGSNVVISCEGGTTAPTCSVTPSSQTIGSNGGSITLTASNCGTGSWTSNRSGALPGSSTSYSDSIPASTTGNTFTYTFTGSISSASATVNQLPGTPTSGEAISCSNIPGIARTKRIDVAWETTMGNVSTSKSGGFAPGDAVVFVVKPPAGATTGGKQGIFGISPSDANSYYDRIISLSARPCDFSGSLGTWSVKKGQEPSIYFSVGGPAIDQRKGTVISAVPVMQAGQEYYFTVIHQQSPGGANTCMSSNCNVNYGLLPGT
jgi:hypothetical protein